MNSPNVIETYIYPNFEYSFLKSKKLEIFKQKGILGDRYYESKPYVSFIGIEDINKVRSKLKLDFEEFLLRRNIITENLDLSLLINKKFSINKVLFYGCYFCRACKHIEEKTKIKGLVKALYNNGGILARPLSNGVVEKSNKIRLIYCD